MLSAIVGPVDLNAAFVLVAVFFCICIITTSLIVKRRSSVDVSNEFALAKMKQEAETAARVYELETSRQYKFKQLDQNLITSHSRED